MTALPREYTDFRRQVRVAAVRLRNAAGGTDVVTSVPIEKIVVECVRSFAQTTQHRDGTRSRQIKAWVPVLTRVAAETTIPGLVSA